MKASVAEARAAGATAADIENANEDGHLFTTTPEDTREALKLSWGGVFGRSELNQDAAEKFLEDCKQCVGWSWYKATVYV